MYDSPVTIELDHAAPDAERVLGSNFDVDVIAPNIIFGEGPIWDKHTTEGGHLYRAKRA